jgi:hypothetical protein
VRLLHPVHRLIDRDDRSRAAHSSRAVDQDWSAARQGHRCTTSSSEKVNVVRSSSIPDCARRTP